MRNPSGHVVVAGPCVSEFGWELMEWQAYVRRLAQGASRVVVCSTRGHDALYADMSPTYIPHTICCARDAHLLHVNSVKNPTELSRARALLVSQCRSAKKQGRRVIRLDDTVGKLRRRAASAQSFIRFGNAAAAAKTYPLVVHARDRHDAGPRGGDNYDRDRWDELLHLLVVRGVVPHVGQVAAIGSTTAAFAPRGTVDLRGLPMQQLVDTLAAARLVLGPSSGPMHLASLCGTPHFVWATDCHQPVIGRGNYARYVSYWNPFGTPVQVALHEKGSPPAPSALAERLCAFAELPKVRKTNESTART